MSDERIKEFVLRFRKAVDLAKQKGLFSDDNCFSVFPHRCCRDASLLLAEYLKRNEINTILYSAANDTDTHAWLIVNDDRIQEPNANRFSLPEDVRSILSFYSGKEIDSTIINEGYSKENLASALIIDITADQYENYYSTIYIGFFDDFHDGFDCRIAQDFDGLGEGRLSNLYDLIEPYIKEDL